MGTKANVEKILEMKPRKNFGMKSRKIFENEMPDLHIKSPLFRGLIVF